MRRAFLRNTLLSLAVVALAATVVAGEASPLDGQPIVRVVLRRMNVFDTSQPKTSSWPYRLANSLHVVSRERFVRSMLLFEEGDPYSADMAAESARILRSLGFLNPVEISARPVEGGVEVVVETHDQWTLEAGAEFGLAGKQSRQAITFKEKNFLGRGQRVSVEYESDKERDSWTYELYDPNLRGSRWRARLLHGDSSDGYSDEVRVDRPFFALATRRAWGLEASRERLDEHLYADAEAVVSGRHESEAVRLFTGIRLPAGRAVVHRVTAGWDYRRDRYGELLWRHSGEPYPTPEDRTISGPRLTYQRVADRFVVLQGFRAWTAQEDLALGPNLDLGLTASLPLAGGDRRLVADGRLHVARVRNGWVLLGEAWAEGRVDRGRAADWVGGVEVAASRLGRQGWQARLKVEDSLHLDRDRQLTLGADVGLRGWDPDAFAGTGRAIANLQWRRLVKEGLGGVLSLGAVVFADAGATWGARVGPGTVGVRTDIGIGLLADMTRVGVTNVLRIDLALPDDGGGLTLTVTSSTLF